MSKKKIKKSYILKQIKKINSGIIAFSKKEKLKQEDLRSALRTEFEKRIQKNNFKERLYKKLQSNFFKKSKVEDIANEFKVYKKDLEDFYKSYIFKKISQKINFSQLIEENFKNCKALKDIGLSFIKNDLKKLLEKSLFLTFNLGFSKSQLEAGLKTAQEGDSTQFLFVARSILAGFNCSNVDLGISSYDAVIDHNSKLFKVQVKGLSGNSHKLYLQNRPRGGKGIDYKDPSNQGKRITKEDCDFLVGVGKEFGLCYIVPCSHIEKRHKNKKSLSGSNLNFYKEKWSFFTG